MEPSRPRAADACRVVVATPPHPTPAGLTVDRERLIA